MLMCTEPAQVGEGIKATAFVRILLIQVSSGLLHRYLVMLLLHPSRSGP